MTEKLNTSNISILQTNTAEEIGIKSIANGVKDNVIAKTLIEQGSTNPNNVTKATVSILESIMNCKITEQTNNQYVFARYSKDLKQISYLNCFNYTNLIIIIYSYHKKKFG